MIRRGSLTDEERDLAGSVWDVYRPYVEAIARIHLTDQADNVPDVVQNVGLIISERLPDFRGAGGLRTWIFRITLHEARRVRRVEHRHAQTEDNLSLETQPRPLTPLDHLERNRTIQSVRNALAGLKPRQRKIIRHELDTGGLYTSETRERSLRYRARKELRRLFDRS